MHTKHGNINTDHILFVASGAFHHVKPSDLLAALQGRLPIRVELQALTEKDMYTILTEPVNNLCTQQVMHMSERRSPRGHHASLEAPHTALRLPLFSRVREIDFDAWCGSLIRWRSWKRRVCSS